MSKVDQLLNHKPEQEAEVITKSDNVYIKLQKAKTELKNTELKKSGKNTYSGFSYFELSDFLPEIIDIFTKLNLFSKITFTEEYATLTVINADNPAEIVEYTSPMRHFETKGNNPMQSLGGVQTYQRRYLYMSALDITEKDVFDSEHDKNDGSKQSIPPNTETYKCEDCGKEFKPFSYKGKDYDAKTAFEWSAKKNGRALCFDCAKKQGDFTKIDTNTGSVSA